MSAKSRKRKAALRKSRREWLAFLGRTEAFEGDIQIRNTPVVIGTYYGSLTLDQMVRPNTIYILDFPK